MHYWEGTLWLAGGRDAQGAPNQRLFCLPLDTLSAGFSTRSVAARHAPNPQLLQHGLLEAGWCLGQHAIPPWPPASGQWGCLQLGPALGVGQASGLQLSEWALQPLTGQRPL